MSRSRGPAWLQSARRNACRNKLAPKVSDHTLEQAEANLGSQTHPRRRYGNRRCCRDHAGRAAPGAGLARRYDGERQRRSQYCTDNTLRTLDFIGRGISLSTRAAQSHSFAPISPSHGRSRKTTAFTSRSCRYPPATSRKQDKNAVEFLIETFRHATEEIVLVPVGPPDQYRCRHHGRPGLRQERVKRNRYHGRCTLHGQCHAGGRDSTSGPTLKLQRSSLAPASPN